MTRFRITVRGDKSELRGYITTPSADALAAWAKAMEPIGMVIASPAPDDYDPFTISEPEYPPTVEGSTTHIRALFEQAGNDREALIVALGQLHFMQANVIRGERAQREQYESELIGRELHHFETEQILERVRAARANHPKCEKHPDDDVIVCGWKRVVQDIDKALA